MRTIEEIRAMVKKLEDQQKTLPDTTFFGDSNTDLYKAMIDIIQNDNYKNYQDADDYVEQGADRANLWLHKEITDEEFLGEEE